MLSPPTCATFSLRLNAGGVFLDTLEDGLEIIENFYGKKRMRNPKMATQATKFRER